MALLGTIWLAFLALFGLSVRPDAPPYDAAVDITICTGLSVLDGSVSCFNNGGETVCQVECGGRDRGEFRCTVEKGWNPKLPGCATPILGGEDDKEVQGAEAGCMAGCRRRCAFRGVKTCSPCVCK